MGGRGGGVGKYPGYFWEISRENRFPGNLLDFPGFPLVMLGMIGNFNMIMHNDKIKF